MGDTAKPLRQDIHASLFCLKSGLLHVLLYNKPITSLTGCYVTRRSTDADPAPVTHLVGAVAMTAVQRCYTMFLAYISPTIVCVFHQHFLKGNLKGNPKQAVTLE